MGHTTTEWPLSSSRFGRLLIYLAIFNTLQLGVAFSGPTLGSSTYRNLSATRISVLPSASGISPYYNASTELLSFDVVESSCNAKASSFVTAHISTIVTTTYGNLDAKNGPCDWTSDPIVGLTSSWFNCYTETSTLLSTTYTPPVECCKRQGCTIDAYQVRLLYWAPEHSMTETNESYTLTTNGHT